MQPFPQNNNDHALFDGYISSHPVGTPVRARVLSVHPFGAFCELAEGITGLLLIPYFADGKAPVDYSQNYPAVGAVIDAWIRIISVEDQKIGLTQLRDT